ALTWRALTPPEHMPESERQMAQLAATGRIGPYEKEYFCKDGSRSWMLLAGADLGDGMIGEYCVEVSDRKRADEAVRASEEHLRLILESATDYAIVTLAPDRTVTAWSPGAAATFGYPAEEIIG